MAAALFVASSAVVVSTQATTDPTTLGPKVGATVPGFTLPNQDGTPTSLKSVLKANGALLVFSRSADW